MVTLLISCLLVACGFPHGELDQRIQDLTLRIEASPDDMELRMKRGELYLQHEDYELAKQDFNQCLERSFQNTRVYLGLGESLLRTGPSDSSLYYLDLILRFEPEHLTALELKSEVLGQSGQDCEAAIVLGHILKIAEHPSPLLYIRAASHWKFCDEDDHIMEAIRVLQEGVLRTSGNRVLYNHLIQIYKSEGMYEDAILIQTKLIEESDFKIRLYYERAQTFLELQSPALAQADLQSALAHWDELPTNKKDLESMIVLRQNMTALLLQTGNQ